MFWNKKETKKDGSKEKKYKLSANVLLLGVVSFLNDLSSEMIMPILPMFIQSLGGKAIAVGLVGGVRDSISSILKVICGYFSDKTGKRKPFVIWGYFISGLFKLALVFSQTWRQILFFSGLERVGKGLRTAPRDAIIAESMPQTKGRGFGLHRTLDTLGAISGASLVFFLIHFLKLGFKPIILVAAIVAFISLIPLYFVRDTKKIGKNIHLRITLNQIPKSLKVFILISSLFSLGNFSYMFLLIKAQQLFTSRFLIAGPVLLYLLFNLFYATFSFPSGIISDRVGRRFLLCAGYSLFFLIYSGFVVFNSLFSFVCLFALYGIGMAIMEVNQRAFVADLSKKDFKATALGAFHTIISFTSLLGNLIAGIVWQLFAPSATFILGSLLSLVAAILLIILGNYLQPAR